MPPPTKGDNFWKGVFIVYKSTLRRFYWQMMQNPTRLNNIIGIVLFEESTAVTQHCFIIGQIHNNILKKISLETWTINGKHGMGWSSWDEFS